MDLKQLEALVGIDDHGSFSAAASALGTVQSNISGRIARLEAELATTLIERSSGQLTEDGQLVLIRARRVLAELESMMADVLSAHSEVSGTVRVGMIGTTGRWLIPQIFASVRAHHPRIVLRVTEGTTTTLEPQLLQGQLDFAVLTLPVDLNVSPTASDLWLEPSSTSNSPRRQPPRSLAVSEMPWGVRSPRLVCLSSTMGSCEAAVSLGRSRRP